MLAAILTLTWVLSAQTAAASPEVPKTAEVDRLYKALDARTREIVDSYLRTDCEVGEGGAALKAVLAIAEKVRSFLVTVAREGPPSAIVRDFDRGLEKEWEARQVFLKSPEARDLGEASFRMMTAITKEQFLKDQRAALQSKYRERAELALRAMSAPETKKALPKTRGIR